MKKDIAESWVKALRSGLYEQGDGALRLDGIKPRYCCLGVLADLGVRAGALSNRALVGTYLDYETITWAGVQSGCDPHFRRPEPEDQGSDPEQTRLSWLNDRGISFGEIADLIEAHADEL